MRGGERNAASSLKEQQVIISEHGDKSRIDTFALLNELTENSIVVTNESLINLKENPEYIFSDKNSSLKSLLNKIENNEELHTTLIHLKEALLEQEKYSNIDFEDEEYSKIYADVFTSLSEAIEKTEADTAFSN